MPTAGPYAPCTDAVSPDATWHDSPSRARICSSAGRYSRGCTLSKADSQDDIWMNLARDLPPSLAAYALARLGESCAHLQLGRTILSGLHSPQSGQPGRYLDELGTRLAAKSSCLRDCTTRRVVRICSSAGRYSRGCTLHKADSQDDIWMNLARDLPPSLAAYALARLGESCHYASTDQQTGRPGTPGSLGPGWRC